MDADEQTNGRKGGRKLREAVSMLERIDRYRDLPVGVVIAIFFLAIAIGVSTFFWTIDLAVWIGLSENILPVVFAYMVTFVVIAFSFLGILSILESFGFHPLESEATSRLSGMTLSQAELGELDRLVGARRWRHKELFRNVVTALSDRQIRA